MKYVKITEKILEHQPTWGEIVGKVGIIIKKGKYFSRVRIYNDLSSKEFEFTVPNDCLKPISAAEYGAKRL